MLVEQVAGDGGEARGADVLAGVVVAVGGRAEDEVAEGARVEDAAGDGGGHAVEPYGHGGGQRLVVGVLEGRGGLVEQVDRDRLRVVEGGAQVVAELDGAGVVVLLE